MMKRIIMTITLILCFSVVASFADEFGDVEIHGFLAQGFIQSDDNNYLADTSDGTFEFNEMGINFSTFLTQDLHVGMQFFARDLGDFGNDEIVLDWAYADYRYMPWLGLRAGKMKTPFGLYNETRDVDMLRTSILLPQGVYNEGWRDTLSVIKGAGAYGYISFGPLGDLLYNCQTGIREILPNGGMGKFAQDQGDLSANSVSSETSYNGSVVWETPLQGLKIGSTLTTGKFEMDLTTNAGPIWQLRTIRAFEAGFLEQFGVTYETATGNPATYADAQANGVDLVGLNIEFPVDMIWYVHSVEFVWNELTIVGEYSKNKADYYMYAPALVTKVVGDTTLEVEGWYGALSYRVSELFEFGIYYSEFYPDASDKDGSGMVALGYPTEVGWSKDWCLSTRFDVNEDWVIKVEGHHIDGLAVMFMGDQNRTPAGGYDVDDKYYLGAVKVSYSF